MPKNNEARNSRKVNTKTAYRTETVASQNYVADESISNLEAYFGRVRKGQSNVYDTPFAKGESDQELLGRWDNVLESISRTWPTLYAYEKDLAAKVGPLSIMAPLRDRIGDIADYFIFGSEAGEPVSSNAVAAVLHEFSIAGGLQMRGQDRTIELMKKSTNSGTPYFTKRREALYQTIPFEIQDGDSKYSITHYSSEGFYYFNAAVLGWRGQEGGPTKEDVKQRVVWMFPLAVNIRELQVYQPLIEAAQKFNIVPAWVGMEQVDRHITALFDSKARNDLIICTDFTKFDQHFNPSLQRVSQTLLGNIFNGSASRWLSEIYPIKYSIPMMIDAEDETVTIMEGYHGMASGSGGTNADETLAHRALQYEAAQEKRNRRLNPYSQCLGDDGIISYPGITVEEVTEVYKRHGLDMNESKQYASHQDCVYLRRWHHEDYRRDGVCVGVYSTFRALGRLRYLERYMDPERWGPKMVALRQLSIIENVKYHPLADQFAEFCMKRDKYRLGIDIPGFLDNLETEVQEAIESMPDFMGYTRTLQSEGDPTYGINSWWIVKYLKSKR